MWRISPLLLQKSKNRTTLKINMIDKKSIALTRKRLRHGCAVGAFAASALWVGTDNFGLNPEDEQLMEKEPQSYSSSNFYGVRPPPLPTNDTSRAMDKKLTDASVPLLLLMAYMAVRRRLQNRNMAYHEAGHAITLIHTNPTPKLDKVWIDKKSFFAHGRNEFDHAYDTIPNEDVRKMMTVAFAGQAGERIGLGDYITWGSANDHKLAHDMAHAFVENRHRPFTERTMSSASHVVQATGNWLDKNDDIKQLLSDTEDDAYRILLDHEDQLHTLAEALLEHEVLTAAEVFEVLGLEEEAQDFVQAPMEDQALQNS